MKDEPSSEPKAYRWCPDCRTKNSYELGDRWTCSGCGAVWVRGSAPTCKMLIGYSSDRGTPDVECGQPASHIHVNDEGHYCCALCFAAMSDDPQLAGEYLKLSLPETSTAERTVLEVETPGAATMALFQAGLERSGMTFQHCAECTREYGSRDGSDLCPPCREPAKYGDGWAEKYPERMRFTQRARLLALVLHRGSERLAVEHMADLAAEAGETDFLAVAEAALDGDELAWRETMFLEVIRHAPSLAEVAQAVKSEVHVEVRSNHVQG